jgi:hypothetical protein
LRKVITVANGSVPAIFDHRVGALLNQIDQVVGEGVGQSAHEKPSICSMRGRLIRSPPSPAGSP